MNALYDERLHRMMRLVETKADKEAVKKIEEWAKSEIKKLRQEIEKGAEEVKWRIYAVEEGVKKVSSDIAGGIMIGRES